MLRLTFALPECALHAWGFASPPKRYYLECDRCRAEYSIDALRTMATREARLRGEHHIHVYCCARPASGGATVLRVFQGRSAAILSADYLTPEQLPDFVPAPEPQCDEPSAEREPAVCRWCKGKREITVNFKTKPCDCVKQENADKGTALKTQDELGREWKLKHPFRVGA